MSTLVSYPAKNTFVIVAPDIFLNCNAVPPKVDTAVKFVIVGLLLSPSASIAVENPSLL